MANRTSSAVDSCSVRDILGRGLVLNPACMAKLGSKRPLIFDAQRAPLLSIRPGPTVAIPKKVCRWSMRFRPYGVREDDLSVVRTACRVNRAHHEDENLRQGFRTRHILPLHSICNTRDRETKIPRMCRVFHLDSTSKLRVWYASPT